jgi:hypothetical protein
LYFKKVSEKTAPPVSLHSTQQGLQPEFSTVGMPGQRRSIVALDFLFLFYQEKRKAKK